MRQIADMAGPRERNSSARAWRRTHPLCVNGIGDPRLSSSGEVVIETSVAEVGVGNTAVPPVIAAEVLGVLVDRMPLVFGNADLPFAPQVGGSSTVASVGGAILPCLRRSGAANSNERLQFRTR